MTRRIAFRIAVTAAIGLAAASSILSPQPALAAYPGANGRADGRDAALSRA